MPIGASGVGDRIGGGRAQPMGSVNNTLLDVLQKLLNQLLCIKRNQMIFENIIYNYKIHRLLTKFAKQRITVINHEQNIWLIEYAVEDSEENSNFLRTCHMRGWIEPLKESVNFGKVNDDGTLVHDKLYHKIDTMWKLTDSGWSAINRSHQLAIFTIFLSLISIVIAIK